MQIRSDMIIADFLAENIEEILDKDVLVVNENYWYKEPYVGRDCNEMIMCSGKNVFKQMNQLYLHEEKTFQTTSTSPW